MKLCVGAEVLPSFSSWSSFDISGTSRVQIILHCHLLCHLKLCRFKYFYRHLGCQTRLFQDWSPYPSDGWQAKLPHNLQRQRQPTVHTNDPIFGTFYRCFYFARRKKAVAGYLCPALSISLSIRVSLSVQKLTCTAKPRTHKLWPIFSFAAVLRRLGGVFSFMDIDSSSALWSWLSTFRMESISCL